MGGILLYHGSKIEVAYPEIRITNIQKIFQRDFIVRMIISRHIDGQTGVLKMELLMCINILKILN